MNWAKALQRAGEDPRLAIEVGLALARGQYYRWLFRLRGQRVVIGSGFQVTGRLDIRGPGTVIFGDRCKVISSRLAPTTPFTHAKDAVIRFGDEVLLTGTRLGCQHRIEVGNRTGLADCRVMDTDFHRPDAREGRRYDTSGGAKPIVIGENAWVGAGAMVLKGVRIGDNAVVGAGSVVIGNVPADAVVFGNPARVIWRFPAARKPTAAESAPAAADQTAGSR
jgi:acetyltransferase-like isoleucine patch superfamily enzyme